MKFTLKSLLLCFILGIIYIPINTTNLDFRQSENSALLTPYNILTSVLLDRILTYLTGPQYDSLIAIQNPTVFDSSNAGAYAVYSKQGTLHNQYHTYYWDNPLIINNTDTRFTNVNIIRFLENISYKPTPEMIASSPYPAAIIIDRDNVTVDLFGFSLTLDDSLVNGYNENALPICTDTINEITKIYGIYVTPGTKNVRIISSKNQNYLPGTIRGFTSYGIYMDGGQSEDPTTYFQESIDQALIEQIFVSDNQGGIFCTNGNDVTIKNTTITGTSGEENVYGIYLEKSKNIIIDNCKITSQIGCAHMYCVALHDCISGLLKNVTASFNTSLGGNAYGFYVSASTSNSSYGIYLDQCTANENIATYASGVESAGIAFTDNTYNNTITHCTCLSNSWLEKTEEQETANVLPVSFGMKFQNSYFNEITENEIGTNKDYGIYDGSSTLNSQTASTNVYTKNKAFFNSTNYHIYFQSTLNTLQPLQTVILYPGDLSALNTANEIENIEIRTITITT